jgi:preprotein translocase subunit SecD
MTVMEILRQFPAIWATLGLLVGGGVMFWVTKKFGPMRNDALNEVIGAYKEQVKAQIALSATQAEQNMATLTMQKDHWAEELAKMEKERNNYRNDLHAEREIHNAAKLKVQELEMRPSLELVQTEQQSFYRDMTNTLKGIAESMKLHDDKSQERFEELIMSLRKPSSKRKVA